MNLFVTGMMRSGTTLLQRTLNMHPDIRLSYQDQTQKFLDLKRNFHKERLLDEYHSLSNYSPNIGYSINEFTCWLEQKSHGLDFFLNSNSQVTGVKEVLTEEFLPYFIKKKIKCINIIRDPRDVICSMSFGQGFEYTGLERPVLFDIKNWRKSVLISYFLRESKYLLTIRMEDLLLEPELTMRKIYNFINVKEISFEALIEQMESSSWKGNSSFKEKKLFDKSSIENFKYILPKSVIQYIESTSHQEMKYMGYEFINKIDKSIIFNYRDPFEIKRSEFRKDYSSSKDNVDYELNRFLLNLNEIVNLEICKGRK